MNQRMRPVLPLEELDQMVEIAIRAARDQSTNVAYDSHLKAYLNFIHTHNLEPEPTPRTLARFICYISLFVKPSTAGTYLSSITVRLRYIYPIIKQSRYADEVKDALMGCKRMRGAPIARKAPLTTTDLTNIAIGYEGKNGIDDRLFFALLTIGFFGLLRLGELTDPNDARLINRRKTIQRDTLNINDDYLSFILPASKTDKFFAGNQILLRKSTAIFCPVTALKKYLYHQDRLFPQLEWLWLTTNSIPPSQKWFMCRFRDFFGSKFGGHSLRAGGATFLAQNGVDWNIIQALGRWSSDAFKIYIRQHPLLIQEAINCQT